MSRRVTDAMIDRVTTVAERLSDYARETRSNVVVPLDEDHRALLAEASELLDALIAASIDGLERFRTDCAKLILFASYACDGEPEELSELDLIAWLYRQAEPS